MISFPEAVETCMIKKFATMSGRATRAEYWWFQLFIWLGGIIIGITSAFGAEDLGNIILIIFFVVTLIPNLCVCVRRLHDRGLSGNMFWWCLLGLGFGLLIINIVNMMSSDDDNEYGPKPSKANFAVSNSITDVEIIQGATIQDEQTEGITDVNL